MVEPIRFLRASVPRVVAKAHIDAIIASGLDPFQYFLDHDLLTWSYATEEEWKTQGDGLTVVTCG